MVFESLMKSIIGSYMLNGDYKKEYSMLPKDFIDLDNNTITWHSDSGTDNILKLSYSEKNIKISISKSKDAPSHHTNAVRIRTSGSMYEYYYQEFLAFFKLLRKLESRLNPPITKTEPEIKQTPFQRKLSLFKRMSKNE